MSVHEFLFLCARVCMSVCVPTQACVCVYVHMSVCVYLCVYVLVSVHVHISVCVYAHACGHTHSSALTRRAGALILHLTPSELEFKALVSYLMWLLRTEPILL